MLTPPHVGYSLLLTTDHGKTQLSSANEICRLLCVEVGEGAFTGAGPVEGSLVDYWLDWEVRELKVRGERGV